MNDPSLIDVIRQYREEHARSCGFDLKRIAEDIRRDEEELRRKGWTVVAGKTCMKESARP
ncbi:MAG: hypothetical protein QG656_1131 [Candidatus Hydrogenedentes bacterium]|nr:hypothetical protein [Candidatus Hydrogenedentota bacterium]